MIVSQVVLTSPLGDTLTLGDMNPTTDGNFEGFTIADGVTVDPAEISVHNTNLPLASGGVVIGGRYMPRLIDVSGVVVGDTPADTDTLRRSLVRVLSDHQEPVTVEVTDGTTARVFNGFVSAGPTFRPRGGLWLDYRFEVTCGNPVAFSTTQETVQASLTTPGALVSNVGDATVHPVITVTWVGADTGFTVENTTTGEKVEVSGLTVDATNAAEVDSTPGAELLTLDGVTMFDKMTAASRFPRIIPGANRFHVTSPAGNARAEVVWTSGWVS